MAQHTPRLILLRHGQTTWSATGRHTSTTDLALTHFGRTQITASLPTLPISAPHLTHIFVSPRLRARETLDLVRPILPVGINEVIDERLREWTYGDYEGLKTAEIKALRAERGVVEAPGREWDIWRDGCEGGESPAEVTERLDAFIDEVVKLQWDGGEARGDVLVVAHGHLCRALIKRWVGLGLGDEVLLLLDVGAAGVLSYAHHRKEERALMIG